MEPTTKVDMELLRNSLRTALAERDALKNVLRGDEEQLKRVVDQNAALRDRLIHEHQEGEIAVQARDAALREIATITMRFLVDVELPFLRRKP